MSALRLVRWVARGTGVCMLLWSSLKLKIIRRLNTSCPIILQLVKVRTSSHIKLIRLERRLERGNNSAEGLQHNGWVWDLMKLRLVAFHSRRDRTQACGQTEQARRLPVCTSSLSRQAIAIGNHHLPDGHFDVSLFMLLALDAQGVGPNGLANHPTTQSF